MKRMGVNTRTLCSLAVAVTAACLLAGPAVALSMELPDGGSSDTNVGSLSGSDATAVDRGVRPFAMWLSLPNKAWIAPDENGNWHLVTDPEHGNQTGADGHSFFNGDLVAAAVNLTIDEPDELAEDRLELVDDWTLVDRYLDPRDISEVRVYAIDVEEYENPSVDGIESVGEDVTAWFDITTVGTVTKAAAKAEYLELLAARQSAMQFSMLVPFTVNFDVEVDLQRDAEAADGDIANVERNTCRDGQTELANRGGAWWADEYLQTNEPTLCIVRPELVKDVTLDDTQDETGASINGLVVMPGQTITYALDLTVEEAESYALTRLGFVDEYDPRTIPIKESLTVTEETNDAVIDPNAYIVDWDDENHRFVVAFRPEWLAEHWNPTVEHLLSVTFDATVSPDIDWKQADGTVDGGTDGEDANKEDTENDVVPQIVNQGWAVLNNGWLESNEVNNPVTTLDPFKDVTVEVGADSANGMSIYKDQTFLYQLNSSTLPAGRTANQITQWRLDDDFDETGDRYSGQWAVYAVEDLHDVDGGILALQGTRIAGSGFDSTALGGELFTMTMDEGFFTIEATSRYLELVSADTARPQAWRAYVQFTRIRDGEFANTFVETLNGARMPSNTVTTVTPARSPAIAIEKYDEASGFESGDRDAPEEALEITVDGTVIVFRITNIGDVAMTSLELTDETVAGDGEVTDIEYPDDWDVLVLQPGESVEVRGVLNGVTDVHTDRAVVRAAPVIVCVPKDDDPFDDIPAQPVDPDAICTDTVVESEPDDWNAYKREWKAVTLPHTGSDVRWLMASGVAATLLGAGALVIRHVARRLSGEQDAAAGIGNE